MKLQKTDTIIGWIGAAFIIGSYALLSTGLLGNEWRYHLLVGIGSICLVWLSYRSRLWSLVALNTAFFVFAVVGLIRLTH